MNAFIKPVPMQKKTAFTLFHLLLYIFSLLPLSCQSEEEELEELPIHYELPVLYDGVSLNGQEFTVIRTEPELKAVFSDALISKHSALQNLDFAKHSILVGKATYSSGIGSLEHQYFKQGNKWIYRLKVIISPLSVISTFHCGIVVDKIPVEGEVEFKKST